MTATQAPASTEAERLEALEAVIEAGLSTFFEVGRALAEIRDRRLYRVTHDNFAQYLRERWDFSQPAAYAQMYAFRVAEAITANGGTLPGNVTANALRELVPLLHAEGPQAVAEIWKDVMDEHDGGRRPPTSGDARTALRKNGAVMPRQTKPDRRTDLWPIGASLNSAADRLRKYTAEKTGPLPPSMRDRVLEWAGIARALADGLVALTTTADAAVELERLQPALPEGVPCVAHGRMRDAAGVCVACGRPDLYRAPGRRPPSGRT